MMYSSAADVQIDEVRMRKEEAANSFMIQMVFFIEVGMIREVANDTRVVYGATANGLFGSLFCRLGVILRTYAILVTNKVKQRLLSYCSEKIFDDHLALP